MKRILCTILLLTTFAMAQNDKPRKRFIAGDMLLSKVTLKTKIELAIYGARYARDSMLDPESFRVSQVFVVNDDVCMEFRSKNSMGGYVQSAGVYDDYWGRFSQYTGEPERESGDFDSRLEYLASDRYRANQEFEGSCVHPKTQYSKPVDVTDQVKAALKSDRNKE